MKQEEKILKNDETSQKKYNGIKDKELYTLLAVRKGGKTTVRILDRLFEEPTNANKLSETLGVNYNTITFHVKIILEHNYLERIPSGNSYILYPSEKLIKKYDEYLLIREILNKE